MPHGGARRGAGRKRAQLGATVGRNNQSSILQHFGGERQTNNDDRTIPGLVPRAFKLKCRVNDAVPIEKHFLSCSNGRMQGNWEATSSDGNPPIQVNVTGGLQRHVCGTTGTETFSGLTIACNCENAVSVKAETLSTP